MRGLIPEHIGVDSVDMWTQDESRVGQQGSLTRIWAPKGTRPRKVRQQQFISAYIYGASCASTGESFGLIFPETNTKSMQLYLDELSMHIVSGRHCALIIDNAGWHTSKELLVPDNITLIPLPPYSPELNPMEQVWEWIKQNHLSNLTFNNYEDIVDKLSIAWNDFSNNVDLVKSVCCRSWIDNLYM